MKDLFFEACEEARGECDGEPSDERVMELYQDRIDWLLDAADSARQAAREVGL
jgi:hypothetical protein